VTTFFNQALGLRPGDEPNTLHFDPRPEVAAPVMPSTLTVHLLSRATLAPLVARGILLRKGRRLAVAEGEVTQGGKLVAKATVQFAIAE
jgi:acyl-coenzyme A thioesterase PaaI-like protein